MLKLVVIMSIAETRHTKFVSDLVQKEKFHHFLFWILLFFFMVLVDQTEQSLILKLIKELTNVVLYMVLVYINILYLIPKFLSSKKLFIYILSLLIAAIIITPFKILIFYFLYENDPGTQAFYVENQKMILMVFILVGFSSTIYKVMSDWWSHQRQTKELQNQKLQSELKFLRSQINPHFLFNTLNNLYALTLKKSDQAPDMVLRLSEMMRYMLYECNERQVPLMKEINYLKNYLELEKIRQGGNFEINFEVKGDVSDQRIAPLIFIPFVENSFKHGINQQIESGFVKIKMEVKEHEIQMDIENSKAPLLTKVAKVKPSKKSGGIGLVNIQRRLKLLYPEKHLLNIQESNDIFSINLQLQLN